MDKEKPTIVHVSAYYPPHIGGMENVAQMSAEQLARSGYDVRVFTSDIGMDGIKALKQDTNLKVMALRSFEFAHTPFAPTFIWHLLRIPKNSIMHMHLAQAYWPEIVWLVSKLRDIPYVIHFHLDVGPSGFFGNIFLLYKKYILSGILRSADWVIVLSEDQALLVREKYGVEETKITVIPNGVSEKFFFYGERFLPKDHLRLLSVGRLAVQKRIDRLLDALSLLKIPAHLTIVGDGEDRVKLEAQAARLGVANVSFEGSKNGNELMAYFRKADVFVITSDIEGMPLVVLEAMASGLPIVASNVLGLRHLVGGIGVLVDDPSPENFAKKLTYLWKNRDQLQEFSQKSLIKAEHNSWKKLVFQYEKIYERIKK